MVQDMPDIGLEGWGGSALGGHPGVFDLVPQPLDAIEFGAVGGQEVQGDAKPLQPLERGLDALGSMERGVVQDDGQRLVHLRLEPGEKADEDLSGGALPVLGAEQAAAGQQGGHDVQALAPLGLDQVSLAHGRPGAAVGMHGRKARLVEVG